MNTRSKIRNAHARTEESNNDDQKKQEHIDKVNNIIKARKYKKYDIKNICKKNGLSDKDAVVALKKLLHNKLDVNMDVLLVQPPHGDGGRGRRGRDSAHSGSRSGIATDVDDDAILDLSGIAPLGARSIDAAAAVASGDDGAAANNDDSSTREQNDATTDVSTAKQKRIARHEMMQRLEELKKRLSDLRESGVGDDLSQSFDDMLTVIERMKELYKAAPRRPRNAYKGSTDFIVDRDARYKQFANVFPQLQQMTFELANQTRSPMIIAGANGVTYGRVKSSQAQMWMSPIMMMTDSETSQQMYDDWQNVMETYIDNRQAIHSNFEDEKMKTSFAQLLQHANIQNSEAVKAMAQQMNLNFVVDAINHNDYHHNNSTHNRNHNGNNHNKAEMDVDESAEHHLDEE